MADDEHDRPSGAGSARAPEAEPIRVALVGCSGVLGDIIRGVVHDAPDMRVVAESADPELPVETPGYGVSDVDVVLWNNADEALVERLLADAATRHQPPVLTALDDGRQAVLWQLAPHRTSLGALSPMSLAAWIRSAAAPGAAPPPSTTDEVTTKENAR